ncbi:MAG: isocitrate/isopropylmalate family dehydrogenase [Planctomycetota bacterium]
MPQSPSHPQNFPPLGDFVATPARSQRNGDAPLIGILEGEGVGPEVVKIALNVLTAIESVTGLTCRRRVGGLVGNMAEEACGKPLSEEVTNFCRDVFAEGGAILAGAGGGRFVYDLRQEFDLYCKFSPIRTHAEVANDGNLRPECVEGTDILMVRENISGLYFATETLSERNGAGQCIEERFSYEERTVRRIVDVAVKVAAARRGHVTVVAKRGGLPKMTEMWERCTREAAEGTGVEVLLADIDYACYYMVQHPRDVDVIVAPNLLGDILCDLGGILLGSRGLTYSGNFAPDGAAVYQTNHGAAYDLVASGRANPVGQILSLAMLLEDSFGLRDAASRVRDGVASVWRQGFRTDDLTSAGHRNISAREFGDRVVDTITTP